MSYDANGNLQALERYNDAGSLAGDYDYRYNSGSSPQNNQLEAVEGYVNLSYDEMGRVTGYDYADAAKQDLYYTYDSYSRITSVHGDAGHTQLLHTYRYNDRGDRIVKRDEASGLETWFVRDPTGNVVSIYYRNGNSLLQGEVLSYRQFVTGGSTGFA